MPDLSIDVADVKAAERGITPLMTFGLDVENGAGEPIQSIILQVQIRIEPTRRSYSSAEKERLVELFGTPDRWGQSVKSMLWTHAGINVPSFRDRTHVELPVPVTFDLNVATTKYFYGLEGGEIPFIFLFSGSVFYVDPSGRLLMQRIPWELESRFRLPVDDWRNLMERHYPDSAWLYLRRDVFDELYAFRRRNGLPTWDAALAHLLQQVGREEEAL